MELGKLAAAVEDASVLGDETTEVKALAYDSRKVERGTLFFCVPGEKNDGLLFAADAVESGAIALVVERDGERELPKLRVPLVLVSDARAAMAPIAACFHGDPTANLKVIGITGTNGKTTTAFLIWQILKSAGRRTGLLGTVRQVIGGVDRHAARTTPESVDLQGIFREMLDAGDEVCVMEVSSHALDLRRVDAIHFDVALFTNLTQDHLDFHGSMEQYFRSKSRLFAMEPRVSVVNVDDPYGRKLAETVKGCETLSVEGNAADFRARDVEFNASGSRFVLNGQEIRTSLPGHFNVSNALAALVAARALDVGPRVATSALSAAAPPPGRIEPIDEGQPFAVLVDYAHTPDSLVNVLNATREFTENRVIAVFGAGGDRDRTKRPLMGKAGAAGSDLAIVTSDNPRSEEPAAIVDEVLAGIEDRGGVEAEVDRRAAIALAFERAEPGDTVVIAGKGHEQGQEFEGGRKIDFDDRQVAREELRELLRRGRAGAPESG